MKAVQSAERVSQSDASDNFVFQRSILAYHKAAEFVSGNVLEAGTGSGYGVEVVAPHAERFLTIDKSIPPFDVSAVRGNVEFRRLAIPPLAGIPDAAFDYVISFQVIEHIRDDAGAIREFHRVLKPGGRLIISTPNAPMSLTRNPWHVREYTAEEFRRLLTGSFAEVEGMGVFGNDKVMEYYADNRRSVQALMKYDIFDLQHRLPRWCLRLPYDILNRRNRRRLLSSAEELTTSISMDDYRIAPILDNAGAFDLFFVATK